MYCNKNHSKLKRTASTQLKVPFGAPITVTRKLGRLLAHGEWCSRRPTGVIARRCSLCSSSLHQCMHGCVCAAQKAPKRMGVVRHGAEGGKIGNMAETPRANRRAIRRAHGRAEPAAHEAPHLRGRNAQRVLARALRRGGRVVNDVVLAGADAEMKDHARLHRRCIMTKRIFRTTVRA